MKKFFAAIVSLILCCTLLFAACNQESDEQEPAGPDPQSIEISGMKTSFTFGDAFSALGMNVEITFSDSSKRTATSREYTVDSSAYDATAVGDYQITVKLNGTNISKSYTVSVRKTAGGNTGGNEEEKKDVPLDVWILAGQSNAAGYSRISQRVQGQNYDYREYLRQQDERTASGFDVKYYGTADVTVDAAMPQLAIKDKVGLGLGRESDFIGPELGMAKGFADGNTGRRSAIVKYACGGTWLGDVEGEMYTTHTQYGGWSSPSIVAASGVASPNKNCGLMYTRLLATVENAINAFEAAGYLVSVKGFVWMQGEADAGEYSESNPAKWANVYERNLKLFIEDLRKDVAEIAKDEAVKTRPFIIGKINSTGNYGRDEEEKIVRTAQDNVAAADATVYTVESVDLPIHVNGNCVGSDAWHFNAGDMFTLGQRFAEAALRALE